MYKVFTKAGDKDLSKVFRKNFKKIYYWSFTLATNFYKFHKPGNLN